MTAPISPPYSIAQQAQLAQAIDAFLGTADSTIEPVPNIRDLVLSWMTGVVTKMAADEATITALQSTVANLTTEVTTLQGQIQPLLSTG